MDRVLTPEEWYRLKSMYHAQYVLDGKSLWDAQNMAEYAAYVLSNQPKKGIILPKRPQGYVSYDNIYFREGIKCGKTQTIDEVKRLNGIQ